MTSPSEGPGALYLRRRSSRQSSCRKLYTLRSARALLQPWEARATLLHPRRLAAPCLQAVVRLRLVALFAAGPVGRVSALAPLLLFLLLLREHQDADRLPSQICGGPLQQTLIFSQPFIPQCYLDFKRRSLQTANQPLWLQYRLSQAWGLRPAFHGEHSPVRYSSRLWAPARAQWL